jgi:ribosomal protein S6
VAEAQIGTYEAMFIFPDRLAEGDLEGVLKAACGEIEKQGGEIVSHTRLGRRSFARPIKKSDSGHFAVVVFRMAGDRLRNLHGRFKLNEDVVRVQMVRTRDPAAAKA